MTLNWKDTTSYARGDKREPRTWRALAGPIAIVVTRHINYSPDQWLVSCDLLAPFPVALESRDLEDAKSEAIGLVRGKALEIVQALQA